MKNELENFIQTPDDCLSNFKLGYEYDLIGQTSAAVSYYLRAAERTDDVLIQYESLLRCALCFDKQGDRVYTVKGLLQKAIGLLPRRPEAYFLLSREHDRKQEWQECYMISAVGLDVSDFSKTLTSLTTSVEYPGRYGLLFEKGISAWWVGLSTEAREILCDLKYNYKLDEVHRIAIESNILSIGIPDSTIGYTNEMFDNLRFKFIDSEKIETNYSQTFQDMFVLSMLNGKKNGLYLEIGSAEPFMNNNTALLETEFSWKGISIEYEPRLVKEFFKNRNNTVFSFDARNVNYAQLFESMCVGPDFDYLQVDCDPPSTSLEVLKQIPYDTYRFAVITFEHDYYKDQSTRDESRKFLTSKGYKLVVNDIAHNESDSFEDWWVHPELVDPAIIEKMIDVSDTVKYVKDYILPKLN